MPRLKAWALPKLGLALESFLFSMGEKSHSEHHFCPLSIKLLNTIKQGKKEKGKRDSLLPQFSSLELGGAEDTVLKQEPWQSLTVCGAANSAHRLAAWEDLKVMEIRLGS